MVQSMLTDTIIMPWCRENKIRKLHCKQTWMATGTREWGELKHRIKVTISNPLLVLQNCTS